jgi:catecholate siderophore receptor
MTALPTDNTLIKTTRLATAVGVAVSAFAAPAMAEEPAKAAQEEPVELESIFIQDQAVEETSYQATTASSPKYTAPLRDTPRSVTVVPQQVIKDTNAMTLQDALRTVPGITMGAGEGGNPQGDRPIIRGFDAQSDTYLDGVRDVGSQSREIFAIESVEVAKGPNGAIGGRGAAGGTINLVSKRAHLGNSLDGGFTWGSDQTQRYTLDGNYQFTDTIAGRLNMMTHEANVAGRDSVNYDRWGIAPSLAFGLTTDTRLFLDYYHMESDDLPDSGIPYGYAVGNSHTAGNPDQPNYGGDSSNFYGLKGRDFRKTRADIATVTFEHDFNDALTIRNTFRHGSSMQDYILTQPDDSQGNVINGRVWRRANTRVSNTTTTTNQTDLFGEFNVAGFKNSFSTGIELTREESDKQSYTLDTKAGTTTVSNKTVCPGFGASTFYNCTSLSNPNPNDPWDANISRNYAGSTTKADTYALYFADTIELDPQWLLNLGLRYDHFETKYHAYNADGSIPTSNIPGGGKVAQKAEDTSEFVTGQIGLIYKPVENGSIYVSYGTSATPPGSSVGDGVDSNGSSFDTSRQGVLLTSDMEPETTKNYEIGTKWDLLNERLSLTAAIFRTEKENSRVQVDTNAYENSGKTRVDGVELGVSGKLTDKWQVFAGYTYMDSEQVDGGPMTTNSDNDGNRLPNTPQHSATLWTTYNITDKVTVGGGAFYTDEIYGNVANTLKVDSYTRFDAMAAYKLNKHVDFQLNVQNLTDRTYYDKAYGSHFANMAAGRTALLSTNFHF